ncbi:DHA2 family efflux MFS transporter permease subunit [Brevundimonas subvibrioides]|uniref:Drug resistance transporter, EmrB/QacA subfamily n=1 Tax=Brevundimonas subvibrioides (strain ATCC 15264 / DSM 4735 / LMG 14903 / NBRC 16000 / CB 81) TaxID=633149 RepID=D9QJY0_BRESC|nr:DHA2 family efflux MFS transporter permease subunit [Brevundimonas subvibrioides]ADK99731.1 drug resistance transporter, EmrB/QacA subfamily [Brevundimonas subvibrioides ATCC 15264]
MTVATLDGVPARGPAQAPAAAEPKVNWTFLILGFAGMVIGQFMAILDIQIVASSLPQIQSGVGASADQISWIQTAYLIPEVVMIPLSGYLSRLWGTQKVFLMSCAGFVIMSVAVGLSSSVEVMIVFRAIQGFVGGAMIPTVFAVAFTAFPASKRVTASVFIGLIVTLAPTIGPTLGGHLTEALSWHWLFFINVPFGLLSFFLVWRYADFDKGDPGLSKGFDWWGLALMATFLMSLQFVLEEGSKNDWFADDLILLLATVAAITGPAFVWRSLVYWNPVVELRAFNNRNFLVGIVMTFTVGAALFGGSFLLPLFLSRVRDYSPAEVGTTLVVSGLAMFATAPIAGRLVRILDLRILMFGGFVMASWGMWDAHAVTTEWGFWEFAGVQALRGSGIMLAMLAAQQVTMSTMPPHMVKNASGLVNLFRNVGGAFGLAFLNTSLTTNTAIHMGELTSRISISDTRMQEMLAGISARMSGSIDPDGAAMKAMYGILNRQATTLAFGDAFAMLAIGCAFAACVTLLAQPVKPGTTAPPADVH